MSILEFFTSSWKVNAGKKLTTQAREAAEGQADSLFASAYENFAAVPENNKSYADAMYNWGFALLHQADTKSSDAAKALYEQAVEKFNKCLATNPNYLGAAIDGGVALLALARETGASLDDKLYLRAKESFETAETIQEGTASYNLACIHAMNNNEQECIAALNKARDLGLIPETKQIMEDEDLDNIKSMSRFKEFIESLLIEEEEEAKEDKPEEADSEEVADSEAPVEDKTES